MTYYEDLSDEQKRQAAQIIHDCYIQYPYNYDWAIDNVLKYFVKMRNNGYMVGIELDDQTVIGVCIHRFITPDEFIKLKIAKTREFPMPQMFCYIQDICVNPSYQRKGIGKKILSEFGGPVVLFTYVDAPAVEFYKTMGYRPIKSSEVKNRMYFIKS